MAETTAQAVVRRRREREALEAEDRARRYSRPPEYAQRPGGGLAGSLREGVLQADTALRSVANTFTLDGANSLAAGLAAIVPVEHQGLRQRYETRLAAERARDQYDALYRPAAEQVGAGAATALAVLGGRVLSAPKLVAGAAPRSGLETAAVLGAGGVSGLAFQSLSDTIAGRPSDWRDGLGALAGGVIGSAALPLGPGRAAAVGSATATAAQNVLHGRPVSLRETGRSAAAGRVVGAGVGSAGRNLSQSLSPQGKGRLGEAMGAVRSDINRMRRDPGPKKLFKPDGSRIGTIPDGRSGESLFEDKFGLRAALSAGQRMAKDTLRQRYTVYHFLPENVGKIASLPLMGLAPQLANPKPSHRPASKSKLR